MSRRFLPAIWAFTLLFLMMQVPAMAATYVVAPFSVSGAQGYSYLGQAVPSMLTSRLYLQGQFEPSSRQDAALKEKAPASRDAASAMARKFGADYVIWGSITVMGDQASLDVSALSSDGKVWKEAATSPVNALIGGLQNVADSINIEVFGRTDVVRAGGSAGSPSSAFLMNESRGRVQDGDTVIFMNFRPDRARQMTRIFCDDAFTGFERRGGRKQVNYVCMAEYDATMPNCEVAYPPVELKNVLGQYLSENGKTQLRIAETEKYAHVTFFFNGGVEAPYEGEDRCVIPSPKVATYDLKPEMSAPEVAAECVKRIESGKYDVVILNFANCDMVGHTGVFEAAVKAVEAVDTCVDQVVTAVLNAGGCAFITADHGNAEKMMNPDGTPFTAHTTNVVPFVAVGCGDVKLREGGCLADIAPTMLPYIGLPVPAEMTGKSIIVE